MAKFTILAALALGIGCDDKDDSVGEGDTDTDTDSDTDTDTDVIPDVIDVQWGSDSVVVDITGGSGDYEWGVVETGKDAWEAEDCIGGTTGGEGPYCKIVSADSQTTFDCVDTYKDMTNDTTLFCNVDENSLTYYFNATDDSWCGVSGPDASYYAAQGCEAL